MAPEDQNLPSEFILEMFRLSLHDNYIQQIVISKVKPNWFANEEERDFYNELREQVEVDKKKPSMGTMLLAAKQNKNKALQEYIGLLREVELKDPQSTISTLESFIKQAMFVQLYDEMADYYNKHQRKKAYQLLSKAATDITNFSLTNDLFEPVFANFGKRNAVRIIEHSKGDDAMPLGIDGLDAIYIPQRKEYVLFLAGSKGTKSFCMTHCGINYARRGYGVLHFQLEGTKKQTMDRYDTAWLGSTYREVKAGEITEEKFKNYRKIVDNIGKGEIYVHAPERYEAMTMLDIRRYAIDMIRKHPNIAVIIIDYLDLTQADDQKYSVSDERIRKQRTSRAMKVLAMDTNTLVISNSQSNSVGYELLNDANFVLRRENISEDRGTVQAVDGLVTINRTQEEADNGTARLFLDASRETRSGQVIHICQNLSRSRFYDRKRTISQGLLDD